MLSGVYVPFRAPIVTKLYSFDRFLLLRGWVPAINLILITFIPGLLVPMVHPFLNDFVLGNTGIPVPFLCRNSLGYHRFSVLCTSVFPERENTAAGHYRTRIGNRSHLPTEYRHLHRHFLPYCLGLGLGLDPAGISGDVRKAISPLPTRNSQHHPFAGNRNRHFLGIVTACYMELDTDKMLHTGQIVASIALLFFALITYPYYIKKR